MKFHEVSNVTLIMLLSSGTPFTATRKLFKRNELVIMLSRICGWFISVAAPVFTITFALPIFFPNRSRTERVYNVIAATGCVSILFKFFWFNWNISKFEKLIQLWDEFNEEQFYPELREELIRKRKRSTDNWSIGFGLIILVAFTMTSLIPFYTRKIEHPTAIPYPKNFPHFEIFVTYELITTVLICFFVHSYNCFLMQIIALEDVLCNYLRNCLKLLMSSLMVTPAGKIIVLKENHSIRGNERTTWLEKNVNDCGEIWNEAERKMGIWIKLHQKLIQFHEMIRIIYEIPLCMEYSGLVLVICLVVFMMVGDSLNLYTILNFVVYCVTIYTIFYVTCSYGDLTQLSSENMWSGDGSEENWFLHSYKLRISYKIIIMRCGRPLNVMAFKLYPLNSRSFARIFRHSYSFLMFLLQVTNRSKG